MRQIAPEGARTGESGPTMQESRLLFRRLRHAAPVSLDVEAAIAEIFEGVEQVREYRIVLRRGERVEQSMLVLDGMLCRYRDFADGTRQITALYLPGDFVDLASFTLKRTDQDVLALTNCRLALAPHPAIQRAWDNSPDTARLLWLLTNIDGSINREWELSLGQRSALERTAHLFCELQARLEILGRGEPGGYALPMTQVELSQCLAISPVHTNRVLRELRERNLLHSSRRRVQIPDLAALHKAAGFDPAYLYIQGRD